MTECSPTFASSAHASKLQNHRLGDCTDPICSLQNCCFFIRNIIILATNILFLQGRLIIPTQLSFWDRSSGHARNPRSIAIVPLRKPSTCQPVTNSNQSTVSRDAPVTSSNESILTCDCAPNRPNAN